MTAARTAYLALGTNLGDRTQHLRDAIARLRATALEVRQISRVYETEPVGVTEQPRFLNMVVKVGVPEGMTARDLLNVVKGIEGEMGRQARERWGPREIDIDVLLMEGEEVHEPDLEVPHPRMWERAFVLVPLADLAPDLVAPNGDRVLELAERLRRTQGIHAHLSV